MDIGKLGVWSFIDQLTAEEAVALARKLEEWGYGALWIPEAVGRDPFSIISFMAAKTERLVFATGIANIYARDAMTMNAIRHTVAELAAERFILGLGVSHPPMVKDLRGHNYGKPVTTMREYLDAMNKALYLGVPPEKPAPVLLAALRTNMLKLAAEKASGAHPYFVTPEHTKRARALLGSEPLLCPEQKVLLENDPQKARAAARKHMATYLGLDNYKNNLQELGFEPADFDDGGSDKLVDAIVAWGDEQRIRERIQAHWDAGANHVCIQPLRVDGEMGVDMRVLELLAPG
ncbi:MAG: TIGR03620 family F420-dependent LLM class oxidoreductase [Pseudomonadales bacterium]|nr:TIGR03620 family F420-dependent LLM class oxidoreductase [Pseudomonadales bacterium]